MDTKAIENLGRDLRDSVLRLLRDYSEALTLAVLMAVILRLFVFSAYKVSNPTMEPTLKLGDFIVGYRLPYGISLPFSNIRLGKSSPRRGDVVVFRCPDAPDTGCVKRVIGIAGDRIEMKKQRLTVNGLRAQYKLLQGEEVSLPRSPRGAVLSEKWRGLEHNIYVSSTAPSPDFGPYIVPPDSFFVLADNRDLSVDSRHWGAIPNHHIEARLLFIWLSVHWKAIGEDRFRPELRGSRIFKMVD